MPSADQNFVHGGRWEAALACASARRGGAPSTRVILVWRRAVARLSRVAGAEQTLFEELGGEPTLRAIIDRFIDGVFADVMIGFMFARANRERIKAMEYEFAAQHLGAPLEYGGRPLAVAHRAHRIFDGQFDRRLTILRETLAAFAVAPRVREHWLGHTESLRAQITLGACNEPLPSELPGDSKR